MIPKELRIPGYDIEVLLGKGGMAAVYQARQQSFGREVALKVLNPNAEDIDEFSRRFLQESAIVAKLHHSHIVQVYDVGRHQDYFYISMEYLHGGDLSNKLKEGLSLRDSVRIIRQLADALDFAHRKNIIHRDIKPANVMFREDGAAVLTDFGIAKELESQAELTQAGVVIGTPRYMSPEQIRGDKVDHRADIYALGIVFFKCLTNYVPFDGKDMLTTAYLQDNEPVPPLPSQVACFQPIINRMLEKTPETRFQRGKEVVDALENLERSAYQADLTNLDIAAANSLSPPTVTTLSGRHPSIKVPPVAESSDLEGTQVRARASHNPTIRAEHMMDYEPLEPTPRPAPPAASKPQKSTARTVLLLFMLLSVGVFAATHYSDKLTRHYGAALTAQIGNSISQLWRSVSQDRFDQNVPPDSPPAAVEQVQADYKVAEMENAAAVDAPHVLEPDLPPNLSADESVGEIGGVGFEEVSATDTATDALPVAEPEPAEPDQAALISALLNEAEAHMASRRFRRPVDDNAHVKFLQVLELEPENTVALEGVGRIADVYTVMAERAIREKQFDQAKNLINEVRTIAPQRAASANLDNKLTAAIAEHREQQAMAAATEKAAKIEALLAAASADAEAGRIRSPVGNNALEKYQQVLDLDPDNPLAIEKLIEYGR